MPYNIEKRDDEWCVVKEAGGENMGCHDSEEKAERQVAALNISDKTVQAVVVSKATAGNLAAAMELVPKEFMTNSFQENDTTFSFVQYRAELFDIDSMNSFTPDGWNEGVSIVTGDFRVEPEYVTEYITPQSGDGIISRLSRAVKGGHRPGHSVIKAADGSRYMLMVTSNAYQDRENETITTKALENWVDHCWRGDVFVTDNPLLIWHEDKAHIGSIVWANVVDGFLVEVAKEDNTPMAKAAFDYYETPDESTGASHRFAYYRHHKDGESTYHHIMKLETTILPREVAANNLTYGGLIPMSDKRGEYLNKIFGLENAAELLAEGIGKLNEALQAQGVNKKSKDEEAEKAGEDWSDLMLNIIDAQADLNDELQTYRSAEKDFDSVKVALEAQVKDLAEQVGALKTQLDSRPRQASRAAETEIEGGKLPRDVTDSLTEKHPMWGQLKPKA